MNKNDQIRHPQVLLVQDGKKIGVMSSRDAFLEARAQDLDLVEINPNANPPVCAILDYGKFLYEKNKAKKSATVVTKEKEIDFRYVIADHDLMTKANQAREFLGKGYFVKLVVKFKAREKAHKDQGWVVLKKVLELLEDVGTVLSGPSMDGNSISAKLGKKSAP